MVEQLAKLLKSLSTNH